MMFDRVAIIGVGLIGGSLALALKKAGAAKTIAGCGRSTIQQAKQLGLIDEAHTEIAAAVKDADMVVLCTPLSTYAALTKELAPHLGKHAILTDAGSVKGAPSHEILAALSREQRARFVPGHPIAGTEKSGPEAAFAELFAGRKVILTPLEATDPAAVKRVKEMWRATGAIVETMGADAHDAMYAHVSHLVQLLCSGYGVMLVRQGGTLPEDETFRRFIRLCGSDPVMWRDIFAANRTQVLACLEDFLSRWKQVRDMDGATLARYLAEAKKKREKMKQGGVASPPPATHTALLLPLLISATLVESLGEKEYAHVIGGGFRGFTRNALADWPAAEAPVQEMARYASVLEEFAAAIRSDTAAVEALLREARAAYARMTLPENLACLRPSC